MSLMPWVRSFAALFVLALLSVIPAFTATTWTVTSLGDDTGDATTLRGAIAAAAPGDTIVFSLPPPVSPATSNTITLTSGQLLIDKDLTITGPGANLLAISGGGISRVFAIDPGKTVNISDLTITGGVVSGESGGGIHNNNGTLTLTNSTVSGNSAFVSFPSGGGGGGIFNNGGTMTLDNSTVSDNSAFVGAGIFNSGTLIVNNSTIARNPAGFGGGGIFNTGTATLSNSTVSGNSATQSLGGGIRTENSTATLTLNNSTVSGNISGPSGGGIVIRNGATATLNNSIVSGNTTSATGGGIRNDGSGDTLTLNNSTVSGNSAGRSGGGIFNVGTATLNNSTISGNSAGAPGGGILSAIGTLTLTNSTVSGNSAASGVGGLANDVAGTVTLTNTTFSGNVGGALDATADSVVITVSNSILADNPPQNCSGDGSKIVDGVNNLQFGTVGTCTFTFPLVANPLGTNVLADNGGPTQTIALPAGSAAIDAYADGANGCGGLTTTVITTDQRGVARPQSFNCDIGAYEFSTNHAPSLVTGIDCAFLFVNEGEIAACSGTYDDVDIFDDVTITASVGTVTKTGTNSGTWSWSFLTRDGPAQSQTVTVIANDGNGGTSDPFGQFDLLVDNVAPTVDAGPDAIINEGETFFQNGFFTDHEPELNTWTATVNYGDGSGTQPLVIVENDFIFELDHIYSNSGIFTVTVTVTDDDGGSGSDTVQVTVVASNANVAPTVDAGAAATVDEGSTFSRNGSFADPDADTWSATVDYGDGGGPQPLTLSGMTFALSHVYADNGPYTVTVTVSDGAETGSDTVLVTVNNVAPTVSAGADLTIDEGDTFALAPATFNDLGTLDTHTATIDWGDGSLVESGTVSETPFGPPGSTAGANGSVAASHVYADNGNYTVTLTVTDDDGDAGTDTLVVTINNVAPSVDAGADDTINEGDTFTGGGSFTDPGADTWTATVDYGDGTGSAALALNPDKTFSLSHVYADNGLYPVTVTVSDGVVDGSNTVLVTVNNVAPTVDAGPDATINEGDTFNGGGSFTDPGADTWTATVDYGDGGGAQVLALNADKTFSLTHLYPDDGTYTVTVTVTDDDLGVGTDTAIVTVKIVVPPPPTDTVGPVTSNVVAIPNPVEINAGPITLTATVDDINTGGSNIASAAYTVAGGLPIPMSAADGAFNGVTEGVTAAVAPFADTGVYELCVHGTDALENPGAYECIFLPVYNPDGGFVTGGGWIMSPEGASVAFPTAVGKANFGFVSKYLKGATIPTGQTQFQFKAGNLNFHSSIYEWLVVAGARAQYKGTGAINGAGNYGFLLTAIDGQVTGGGVDKFRIKIWDKNDNDAIVYDNQMNAGDDAEPTTALGGGSIVIHTR